MTIFVVLVLSLKWATRFLFSRFSFLDVMLRSRVVLAVLFALAATAAVLLALSRLLPGSGNFARALPVPDGDREIAWLHTSTSASNWERFVAGVQRVPGFDVDDSQAFLNQTTAIPEVVLSRPGQV